MGNLNDFCTIIIITLDKPGFDMIGEYISFTIVIIDEEFIC